LTSRRTHSYWPPSGRAGSSHGRCTADRGVRMRVERQLSLILENRPGVLAEVSADLAAQSINIEAIHVANLADHCVVRLVVSDPQRPLHPLGSAGALVFETEVLALSLAHRPGALGEVA